MTSRMKFLVAGLLSLALAGCAGSGAPREAGRTVDEILAEKNLRITGEVKQLVNFNIRSWQYVNRENVVLQDGPRTYYLVELNSNCPNLEFAQRIAFTSFGRVVNNTDFIIVMDAPGHVERCRIRGFHTLEAIGAA